ncbi:hypothetical protein PybrP1_004966 [[Pythium] brassicae (nom. inval.)]|nr:hypothetical protein PybrP1_004966 [[Pythium] brassicae (nom. inval.)]
MPRGRHPATTRGGRMVRDYSCDVPTNAFRLAVVVYYADQRMQKTLERYLPGASGLTKETKRKSVYVWARRREQLERLCPHHGTSERRRECIKGTATSLPRDSEVDLLKWVDSCHAEGAPVPALKLQRKALQVASEVGATTSTTAIWA